MDCICFWTASRLCVALSSRSTRPATSPNASWYSKSSLVRAPLEFECDSIVASSGKQRGESCVHLPVHWLGQRTQGVSVAQLRNANMVFRIGSAKQGAVVRLVSQYVGNRDRKSVV